MVGLPLLTIIYKKRQGCGETEDDQAIENAIVDDVVEVISTGHSVSLLL